MNKDLALTEATYYILLSLVEPRHATEMFPARNQMKQNINFFDHKPGKSSKIFAFFPIKNMEKRK